MASKLLKSTLDTKPTKLVWAMGSHVYREARVSLPIYVMERIRGVQLEEVEHLNVRVAHLGDTLWAAPLVSHLEHNQYALADLMREYDGFRELVILHHETELALGDVVTEPVKGGKTKHNEALSVAARAFGHEAFSRIGLGVGKSHVEVEEYSIIHGLRGRSDKLRKKCWLNKAFNETEFQVLKDKATVDKTYQTITGTVVASELYDRNLRF